MLKKILVVSALVLSLSACSKITAENYLKLEMGLTKEEVVALLGSPTECSDPVVGSYGCEWKSGEKSISVKFVGDRVAIYNKSGF